jgi:hypothetical protein
MERDAFMRAMDVQQPDWWITFASQQDLVDYVRKTLPRFDGTPVSADNLAHARESMRRSVAAHLEMPVRAYVQGVVT